jgi:hypothetical protein
LRDRITVLVEAGKRIAVLVEGGNFVVVVDICVRITGDGVRVIGVLKAVIDGIRFLEGGEEGMDCFEEVGA